MSNHIRQVSASDHQLSPAEAELRIFVTPDRLTPTTEIRGRLVGPRNAYAATVEVAYPLRPLARAVQAQPLLAARIVIPDPCWWEPTTPFLYEGQIELWEDGQRCDQAPMRHGFRVFHRGRQGLLVNGRPLLLRGAAMADLPEDRLREWHQAGTNLLVATLDSQATAQWTAADRLGFLMLGRLPGTDPNFTSVAELARHPASFGWVLDENLLHDERRVRVLDELRQASPRGWVGVEIRTAPTTVPEGIHFLVGPEAALPALTGVPLPRIIRTARSTEEILASGSTPDILGWIFDSRGS